MRSIGGQSATKGSENSWRTPQKTSIATQNASRNAVEGYEALSPDGARGSWRIIPGSKLVHHALLMYCTIAGCEVRIFRSLRTA